MKFFLLFSIFYAGLLCTSACRQASGSITGNKDTTITIPLGGNTWTTGNDSLITLDGIAPWASPDTRFDTYLRIDTPGTLVLKLTAKSAQAGTLALQIGNASREVTIQSDSFQTYEVGSWTITDTGYLKISMKGVSKTGALFPAVLNYMANGSVINGHTAFTPTNEGNFFYWGRRGPSVHLNYPFADSIEAEWFYNEVTVPQGQDVMGSYFMAAGFGEGYFGMQVNSETERRILFSVWSPFNTDDPASIPADKRIVLLKKGDAVHAGEFGNEGSGGQSYLRYNWKAGNTYKFLLRGVPAKDSSTTYTAYFWAPEKAEWQLIASFKRPATHTWLKHFHSFLENFIPEQGDSTRMVLFGNQWVGDHNGQWTSLTSARFTYDNTAHKGYRMDYAGGVQDDQFFLKNCGFFDQYTLYNTVFQRTGTQLKPKIDFGRLP